MFKKIVDVLKEVFWLKKSPSQKRSTAGKKKAAKKKIVRRPAAVKKPVAKPKAKPVVKAVKAIQKPPAAPNKPAKAPKPTKPAIDPNLVAVGEITHYFERIKVCVVKINEGAILIGDRLTIIGPKTRVAQKVWSMQIESLDVKVAKKGQLIGLKVDKPVVVGDVVYK